MKAEDTVMSSWECYAKHFLNAKGEYKSKRFLAKGSDEDIGGHTEEAAVEAGCKAVAQAQAETTWDIAFEAGKLEGIWLYSTWLKEKIVDDNGSELEDKLKEWGLE